MPRHRAGLFVLAGLVAVMCALVLAASAGAAGGTFERAWGKGVNGGSVFGICTDPANCLAGTSGGLGGEMNLTRGVGLGPSSTVYVAEQSNNRIQRFNTSGTWQRAWGRNVNGGGVFGVCTTASSCLAGTTGVLGGEMNSPTGVAVDASGNVYVADALNNRIQKFDADGNFLRAWGKNVNGGGVFGICTVAANCLAGTVGGLGGEMNVPFGVATDASGNVYVVDKNNNRIQKFDSSGNFDSAWGKNVGGSGVYEICFTASICQAGTSGGLGGEMNGPSDIDVDASGNVYVADSGSGRIQKFDTAGNWDRAWGKNVNGGGVFGVCTTASSCLAGTAGGLGGELSFPTGVTADASGNVYVGDQSNQRIQRYSSSGTWDRAWGRSVNGGSAFGICMVASSCVAGTTGGLAGEMNAPSGVAADGANHLIIADLVNNRVQRFDVSRPTISTQATANVTIGGSITDQATLSGATAATGTLTFNAYGPNDAGCNGVAAFTDTETVSGNGTYTTSPAFTPSTPGTYRWTVSYTGNNPSVTTTCNDANETSVVAQVTPTITTTATANVAFGGQISDQATLAGGSSPTGSITFRAYGPDDATCANTPAYTSNAVTVSGNGNYNSAPSFTPTTAGTYRWRASYSGDTNNAAVSTPCNDANETSVVAQVTPTITGSATANATVGSQISDQATLSGGANPTGLMQFVAYGPNDSTCAGPAAYESNELSVTGNATYGNFPAFTPSTVGTYRWRAFYLGDDNNAAVSTPCNDANQTSVVAQATPTLATQATATATVGGVISDTATISGGSAPTGTITFTAYGPNDATCANAPAYTSNAVTVSGNGNYGNAPAFTPATAGTYRWRASYSGDANNAAVLAPCNAPNESSVVSAAIVPPVVLPPGPTGQRAAALKKCKKIKKPAARRKCRRKANKLPL